MSGAITGDTPEAFVEALHDVNDNHTKDDVESALDYISDAKCEFVKELKYQFSNLEYLEPEIIDFCPRYDVCRDTVKVLWAGKETQVKSFDNPAIEMWVSDRGDVYLRGKLNVTVSNHNGFSDDDVDYIEGVADDVMTNNVDKVTDITWYAML